MNSTYSIRNAVQKINLSRKENDRMPELHKTLTEKVILDAIDQDDNIGFCIDCGELHHDIEPDAECYACWSCGESSVYGAEQILLLMV